jgi:hypothetical protein
MRTRALVAAATLVAGCALAGCERTTPGTVAMTTEAGSSTQVLSPPRPSTSSPDTLAPSTSAQAPPGDALSLTCAEYVQLDRASQAAVIDEILKDKAAVIGPSDAEIAKTLADAVCTFLPNSVVSEILLGETPP